MKHCILIVDDSLLIRKTEKKVFTDLGIDILEAGNGKEALAMLEEHHGEIALVITDINMPVMNGDELLRQIKRNPTLASTPVIVATTESEKSVVNNALRDGASDFIIKPFQTKILRDIVAKYIK